MAKMSLYMVTSSFISLLVATSLYAVHTASKSEDFGKAATIIGWLGGIFLTLALIFRTIASGHGPFANMYEFSVSFAWGIVLSYLVFERQIRSRSLGLLVVPIALLLLVYSFTVPSSIEPLVPALQNNLLLTVHVAVSIFSYGMFAVAFVAAALYLVQADRRRAGWLPSAEILDEVSYKSVIVGVPLFALVIILGAYWGNIAWGRYWGWDPKETASLVTWLIYLGYLHTRTVVGWKGKPSAVLLVVGFIATLFTFFGVNLLLSGLHSYAGLD
ncbi:MAG: c-type cytochrome biogenesis protein CcsB [Chloroflexi bacterium]|nr:c-type cytochrome biogenesis protein CcsB [Chloroflexota bacterium]